MITEKSFKELMDKGYNVGMATALLTVKASIEEFEESPSVSSEQAIKYVLELVNEILNESGVKEAAQQLQDEVDKQSN